MRLLTDEQQQQLRGLIDLYKDYAPPMAYGNTSWVEALDILDEAPSVEQVGKVTDEVSSGFHIEFFEPISIHTYLYAIKKETL